MRPSLALVALLLTTGALAGCIGTDETPDEGIEATNTLPIDAAMVYYELPEAITGIEEVTHIDAETGQGVIVDGGYAYVSAASGMYIVDIHDPQAPEKVAEVAETPSRDVDLIHYEDGRKVAVLAQGNNNMHFVDVTNPLMPELLATLDAGFPVHNLAVVPGTSLVYNSESLGDPVAPGIGIIDAADPANPEVASRWVFPVVSTSAGPIATTGCHDITIFPDVDRAYCAGVTQTFILDISDLMEPAVVAAISNPLINIHHWAVPNQDHTLLIIGDEYGGAAAPACFGSVTEAGRTTSTPTGGIWFYDISDEQTPVLQGYLSPPTPENAGPTPCTAHFGELIEDRAQLVVGWYNAGVLVVDFADPMSPYIVDQWEGGQNVWDARYANGHVYTGDIGSGFSVLQLV